MLAFLNFLTFWLISFKNFVLIVSLDGAKGLTVERLVKNDSLPFIKSLLDSSCYTFQARTVIPSSTLPAHASLLTGLNPEDHGITWNTYRPERGYIGKPTVFDLAKKKGAKTLAVINKLKLKTLMSPRSVDSLLVLNKDNFETVRITWEHIKSLRPNFVFVHLKDLDEIGHEEGWDSKPYLGTLIKADSILKMLTDSLYRYNYNQNLVFLITSDHGGHGKEHGTSLPDDIYVPWIIWGSATKDKCRNGSALENFEIINTKGFLLPYLK